MIVEREQTAVLLKISLCVEVGCRGKDVGRRDQALVESVLEAALASDFLIPDRVAVEVGESQLVICQEIVGVLEPEAFLQLQVFKVERAGLIRIVERRVQSVFPVVSE